MNEVSVSNVYLDFASNIKKTRLIMINQKLRQCVLIMYHCEVKLQELSISISQISSNQI